jgi:hypothetical protein
MVPVVGAFVVANSVVGVFVVTDSVVGAFVVTGTDGVGVMTPQFVRACDWKG